MLPFIKRLFRVSLAASTFVSVFSLSTLNAFPFGATIGGPDPKTGLTSVILSNPTPAEATLIREVYAGLGPTLTVRKTKDGFEVTGQQSAQLGAIVTLLSRTNEESREKVIEVSRQIESMQGSYHQQEIRTQGLYKLLTVSIVVAGICLIALTGLVRNQYTKVDVKLASFEALVESLKK